MAKTVLLARYAQHDALIEQRLIECTRNGEHEAGYRHYERRLYVKHCEAFAILRPEADGDDCAQEAALKAFKNFRPFRAEAISAWQPYSRATIAG